MFTYLIPEILVPYRVILIYYKQLLENKALQPQGFCCFAHPIDHFNRPSCSFIYILNLVP